MPIDVVVAMDSHDITYTTDTMTAYTMYCACVLLGATGHKLSLFSTVALQRQSMSDSVSLVTLTVHGHHLTDTASVDLPAPGASLFIAQ